MLASVCSAGTASRDIKGPAQPAPRLGEAYSPSSEAEGREVQEASRAACAMMQRVVLSITAPLLGLASAMADPAPVIPTAAIPSVRCIHQVLKSSGAVHSVSLYSIDSDRFAIEYAFQDKAGRNVVSDIEFFFFEQRGAVWVTDLVPREVSEETADEAQALESRLELFSKCHLDQTFDNMIPQPKMRADWQKMDWPNI